MEAGRVRETVERGGGTFRGNGEVGNHELIEKTTSTKSMHLERFAFFSPTSFQPLLNVIRMFELLIFC